MIAVGQNIVEGAATSRLGQSPQKLASQTDGESPTTLAGEDTDEIPDRFDARYMGLGRLVLSADFIEATIQRLDQAVQRLLAQSSPDYRVALRLMRLAKDLNGQLINIAIAEIRADEMPENPPNECAKIQPFPCGEPISPPVPR